MCASTINDDPTFSSAPPTSSLPPATGQTSSDENAPISDLSNKKRMKCKKKENNF